MKELDIKNLIERLKLWTHEWKVEKAECQHTPICAFTCQHGQHCSLSAVQRKTAFAEQSWWAWTENVWINAMVFVPVAKAPPKACAKLLYSPKFDPWGNSCRFACENLPTEACLCGHQCFSVVAQATAKIRPRLAQGPRVIFDWKNRTEKLKYIRKWMLIERWRRLSMLSSMCRHVARLQFDSCAEQDSLCGTVMMGLNRNCLDQCHGVGSHGKSSRVCNRLHPC